MFRGLSSGVHICPATKPHFLGVNRIEGITLGADGCLGKGSKIRHIWLHIQKPHFKKFGGPQ